MPDFSYIGTELELFAEATTWKSYFRRHLAPYVGERVLEVGAGNGSTTIANPIEAVITEFGITIGCGN